MVMERKVIDEKLAKVVGWFLKDKPYFRRFAFPVLLLFGVCLFENAVSAYTSYAIVQMFAGSFMSEFIVDWVSWGLIIALEGMKIFLYIALWIEVFHPHRMPSRGLVLGVLAITVFSCYLSIKGAEPRVFYYAKSAEYIDSGELDKFLIGQIEEKRASIDFLRNNSEKSIKWTANKQITELESQLSGLESRLLDRSESIEGKNDMIKATHESKLQITADQMKWITVFLTLLSALILSPIIANFIIASARDFEERAIGSSILAPRAGSNKSPSADVKKKSSNGLKV